MLASDATFAATKSVAVVCAAVEVATYADSIATTDDATSGNFCGLNKCTHYKSVQCGHQCY